MLVNEGALVIKFWFHLAKDGQRQRLKALENDPRTAWRVTKESWARLKTYDKLQGSRWTRPAHDQTRRGRRGSSSRERTTAIVR